MQLVNFHLVIAQSMMPLEVMLSTPFGDLEKTVDCYEVQYQIDEVCQFVLNFCGNANKK